MRGKSLILALGLGALTAWSLTGCGGNSTSPGRPDESHGTKQEAEHGHKEGEHHQKHDGEEHGHHEQPKKGDKDDKHALGHNEDSAEEIAANLAKLSPDDRKSAAAQKICPVSMDPLGEMGVPLKVTVKGKTFFLCCKGCKKELNANPDKFLAELAKLGSGD